MSANICHLRLLFLGTIVLTCEAYFQDFSKEIMDTMGGMVFFPCIQVCFLNCTSAVNPSDSERLVPLLILPIHNLNLLRAVFDYVGEAIFARLSELLLQMHTSVRRDGSMTTSLSFPQ